MTNHEIAVLATLVVYKLTLIGIGFLTERQTHDGTDFFLGGRRLGPLVAAISASASSSSAWTLLGVSGAAYTWGLAALWLFPACVGGFLLNWYLLAPALQQESHRNKALTMTEVLAGPPGATLRRTVSTVASVIILLSLLTYVASQFQGAGKAFRETFGLSLTHSVVIGAGVVVFYTLLGGFWAVSVTDTLQGLLMALTAILLPIGALAQVGGYELLVEGLRAVPQDGYLSLTRNLPTMVALGFILGLLGIGLGYPGQPHVVNRFMALRQGGLPRARRIAIVWAVIIYSGMILLGLCGRILFPSLVDPEVVFITTTNELFHPVLAGIMIAAVLSAIMSTADSQLLVAASSVAHDLNLGGSQTSGFLRRSRAVVVLLSLGAVGAALFGTQEIFTKVLFAWAAMGSAFGPLLLVTVLRGRVPGRWTLASMLSGFFLSISSYYLFTELWGGTMERMVPFFVALAIALAGLSRRSRALSTVEVTSAAPKTAG